jgi:hypothetical protein
MGRPFHVATGIFPAFLGNAPTYLIFALMRSLFLSPS